jgi:hypothetical protein
MVSEPAERDDDANVKLSSVVSDTFGVTGRMIPKMKPTRTFAGPGHFRSPERSLGADDEIRTRDPHLGKNVMTTVRAVRPVRCSALQSGKPSVQSVCPV